MRTLISILVFHIFSEINYLNLRNYNKNQGQRIIFYGSYNRRTNVACNALKSATMSNAIVGKLFKEGLRFKITLLVFLYFIRPKIIEGHIREPRSKLAPDRTRHEIIGTINNNRHTSSAICTGHISGTCTELQCVSKSIHKITKVFYNHHVQKHSLTPQFSLQ